MTYIHILKGDILTIIVNSKCFYINGEYARSFYFQEGENGVQQQKRQSMLFMETVPLPRVLLVSGLLGSEGDILIQKNKNVPASLTSSIVT